MHFPQTTIFHIDENNVTNARVIQLYVGTISLKTGSINNEPYLDTALNGGASDMYLNRLTQYDNIKFMKEHFNSYVQRNFRTVRHFFIISQF